MRNTTALITSHQIPLIEFVGNRREAYNDWRIWINYNREQDAGTFLTLHASGSITRSTLLPTGEVVGTVTIKPRE